MTGHEADHSVQGGCLCGAARFEVSGSPLDAGYCHCTRCQHRTGTASSVNAAFEASAFRVLSGESEISGWTPPDGGAEKCFCRRCGAHLFSRVGTPVQRIGVRLAAFDSDAGVPLSYRQFVAYAAPWEPIPEDGLTRYPESRFAGMGAWLNRRPESRSAAPGSAPLPPENRP